MWNENAGEVGKTVEEVWIFSTLPLLHSLGYAGNQTPV